jgi:hypothetical protein
VSAERERADRLLGGTGMAFGEQPLQEEAARLGAVEGWRFSAEDVQADVFVVETDPEAAAARLRGGDGDLASHNGRIVFRVRYAGAPEGAAAGAIRVNTVAAALAGEE